MASQLRRIGGGFCGTVWASPIIDSNAFKREDGGPGRSLHNEYRMHSRILQSLSTNETHDLRICIPSCHQYIPRDDKTWWDRNISSYPTEFQVSCNLLITDRIPPFPVEVRNTIIDKYCPRPLIPSIKASKPDEDCLIRPYLGRRRLAKGQPPSKFHAFSLRNFPLHVDQMEELHIDAPLYASIMAETLAYLYWTARIDANDVEFVLAPPRHDYGATMTTARTIPSPVLGEHCLWLLDFDCCRVMSQDETGVRQAVEAFLKNDPFCPRPGTLEGV